MTYSPRFAGKFAILRPASAGDLKESDCFPEGHVAAFSEASALGGRRLGGAGPDLMVALAVKDRYKG
jgi:hypothetical protein